MTAGVRFGLHAQSGASRRERAGATPSCCLPVGSLPFQACPLRARHPASFFDAAYAAHPERFVRKPPQPPLLPHAVWINPPKEKTASQDRAEATILITDVPRVARNVEGIGVGSEPVVGSPYAITTPTDEVLH